MNAQIIEHVAWTLTHFVWQGAFIALVAVVLKSAIRNSAEWRYRISVAAMALMLLAPLATFAMYPDGTLLAVGGAYSLFDPSVIIGWARTGAATKATVPWTFWLVFTWIAGVFCLSLRLVVGWNVAQSLVRTASNSVPENVRSVFDRLIVRISMRRAVRLLMSDRVQTAVVIGWLRPVILLPFAAAAGLTVPQLEAILAHELVHIRRHDFAVNVLQCCAECLLFYHPVVWWMSAEIRREREHCCDDQAISICGDRVVYASALVELESARTKPMLAMAASSSDLMQRIRRIFGQDAARAGRKDAALVSFFAIAILVGAACYGMRAEAQQPSSAVGRVATRDQSAWALFHGAESYSHSPDRIVNGRNVDLEEANAAHHAGGGKDMLWFRIDGNSGVIDDAQTMANLYQRLLKLDQEGEQTGAELMKLRRQTQTLTRQMREATNDDEARRLRFRQGQLNDQVAQIRAHPPVEELAQVKQIILAAAGRGLAKRAPH